MFFKLNKAYKQIFNFSYKFLSSVEEETLNYQYISTKIKCNTIIIPKGKTIKRKFIKIVIA